MQADRESSPAVDLAVEEGVSFRPGQNGTIEETEDEEETTEAAGEASNSTNTKQPKPKRIIKQRQSLAEKQPGTTMFPTSRIKKIVKADRDIDIMSSEATFMVAIAAEYFIKHFMEEGYTKARLEKRKIVNYKDMANVVARSEEFDFLKDVIPIPMPLSEALECRKRKVATEESFDDPTGVINEEDLPPLAPSNNPLFPNAIIKKPTNSHSKGPAVPKLKDTPEANANVQGTRKSARRSTLGGDVEMADVDDVQEEQRERRSSEAVADEEAKVGE
ncbi:uncharacterized protein L203_105208 [Cryptococcus depauperatus CBS 7841]|uniref:Transcription factor CBF/NF-Y/archaeal histone domain-containing protein n=1 Tax=Cryptococcus depauperatus CBS 7841 TaxID=1295531 RepID=A0AAJ8JWX1_9TREE